MLARADGWLLGQRASPGTPQVSDADGSRKREAKGREEGEFTAAPADCGLGVRSGKVQCGVDAEWDFGG